MIELITGMVTDIDSHILLVQSRNHGWWELPGTKIDDAWTDPEEALSAALHRKLGLEVVASEGTMPSIATIEKNIAGVKFMADVRHVVSYTGYAMETAESGYSEIAWKNPTHRNLGRIGLSPIADKFLEAFKDDPAWLRMAE